MPIITLNDQLERHKPSKLDLVDITKVGVELAAASTTMPICIHGETVNAFLNAIIIAYNDHVGLRITPDDILQCVSLAVCTCLGDHAEEYRDVFVTHSGQKQLSIVTGPEFNWTRIMELLSSKIDESIQTNLGLESKFSTTTPTTLTVSRMMKAVSFKKFFKYGIMLACGVRKVDLQGTLDDWLQLKQQIEHVRDIFTAKNHMVNWFKLMLQVMDRLIETYQTREQGLSKDLQLFWSRIISYVPYGSGSQYHISGWAKILFPGDKYDKFPETCNLLDVTSKPPESTRDYYGDQDRLAAWAQLCDTATNGTALLEADLSTPTTKHKLYAVAGHIGFYREDDFIIPCLGYYAIVRDFDSTEERPTVDILAVALANRRHAEERKAAEEREMRRLATDKAELARVSAELEAEKNKPTAEVDAKKVAELEDKRQYYSMTVQFYERGLNARLKM